MRDDTVEKEFGICSASATTAPWKHSDLLLLAAISLLAAALRLFHLEQWSFGVVEAETFRWVTQPFGLGLQEFPQSDQSRYPLVYLVVNWLLSVGLLPGYSEGWIRLPFAIAGCLLPAMVAIFGRALFGRGVACMAAALIAVHPAHIEASQTANPMVVSLTIVMAAGIAWLHGLRFGGWLLFVVAGLCHATGWLAGLGIFCLIAASRERLVLLPRWVWWVLLAHMVVMLPAVFAQFGFAMVLLAAFALFGNLLVARHKLITGIWLALSLPLAGGGIWWWSDAGSAASSCLAALAVVALLAAISVNAVFTMIVRQAATKRWIALAAAAVPAIMLLGQLLTASVDYNITYRGGRSDWRGVCDEILLHWQHGRGIDVYGARGTNVLRVYLRPGHWQDLTKDAHPGFRVTRLTSGLAGAKAAIASEDAMLVLQHEEWQSLQGSAAGEELLEQFVCLKVWSSPSQYVDRPLYLFERRRAE